MSVTFTGLASGIDTASLVEQIVAAEKRPADLMSQRVSDLSSQHSIVESLVSKLRAFGDRARGLDLASEIRSVKAERSDTSHFGVAVSGSASTSSHTLRVLSTAKAQTTTSRTFTSDAAGVLGDGSVTIDTSTGDPVTVSWTAADSLSTIATRINDANTGATASVVFDGTSYRLVANARTTGTADAPTFVDSGDGLGLSDPDNITAAASNASFMLDGIPISRGQNVISDVLAGVTLSLTTAHGASESDTILEITADGGAMKDKVQDLLDDYNTVTTALNEQLRYTGTTKGNDTLYGDSTLRSLQAALGRLVTSDHGGDPLVAGSGKTLSGLGITIDSSGLLTLDATKFETALSTDPAAVEALFVDGGLAGKVATLTDTYARSTDGILMAKNKGIDARSAIYQQDIERIEAAAEATGARMSAQFTKMEQAISNMQSQSDQMMQILGLS